MKKLLFWLCIIAVFFSFFIDPNTESALGDLATKSFESFFRSDRAKEIFDLEEEEALSVFGEMPQKTLV